MIKYFLFAYFFIFYAYAGEFEIKQVQVDCGQSAECKAVSKEFLTLKRSYTTISHLQKILKVYMLNEGIKNFSYEIWNQDDVNSLKIKFTTKPVAFEVRVRTLPPGKDQDPLVEIVGGLRNILTKSDYDIELPTILPVKEGGFVDESKINKTIELLKNTFINKGFPDANIVIKQSKSDFGMSYIFNCYPGRPIRVSKIEIKSNNTFLRNILLRKLSLYSKKVFDLQEIKDSIDEIGLKFSDFGYYLNEIAFRYKRDSKYEVSLYLEINNNGIHSFDIMGSSVIDKLDIKDMLKNYLKTFRKELDEQSIIDQMKKMYIDNGFLEPEFNVNKLKYENSEKVQVIRYQVQIKENQRFKTNKISFIGNEFFSDMDLEKLFYQRSFYLNSYGIYDQKYYEDFKTFLRETYISKGFVNVQIEDPKVNINSKKKDFDVEYRIREGVRSKVDKINFVGVPDGLANLLKQELTNKEKTYFNPLELDNDLIKITDILSKEGYYFSSIINSKSPNLVSYSSDNSQVQLNVEIDLKQKIYLNNVIIIGNRKTRNKIIKRALKIKEGELLTKDAIRASQTSLLGLGLFSSINLSPVESDSQQVDLLVSLKEKDFGVIELAPGVRTDLGFKLSGSLSYINIDGLNKQISFKGQVNQRFDYRTLDERRREEHKELLEYQSSIVYNENNIFNSGLDFNTSISTQRRRFFSFDADIQRINATLARDWTNWFGSSLKLQVESISQYDASEDRDEGYFQIGSLTPTISFDFRNNRIVPTKGAFFNLSAEFASPTFFSQANDELVVNYYKLVSRSRFYIPFPNGTFAISLTAGSQKNLATNLKADGQTEGIIPNIKVFRLSGIDIVRGFEDDEINRLVTGEDISEIVVDDSAYMANIKLEPRFFLSDSMMLGLFYDAGRVFVGSYDLNELRSSVGITFKYLTPVGSLDFDYGIKLLRKRDADGILENPGRLHVSIGFF